ncbi:MAG: peroxidase [Alphaproteobacteria bacterium]|nr:MAG: peroxidase [Alphaproteobacteria bacterium]
MAFFSDLPDRPHLSDVFQKFPTTIPPLIDYHDRLLRGPSPFTLAERELIAAYVSGTNACSFCYGAHTVIAESFGMEEQVLTDMMSDLEGSGVDPKMKPILAYVGKLTREPSKMTEADADAVYAAGWDEQALFDAVQVCALFNYMNRILEGTGVKANPDLLAQRRQNLKEVSLADRKASGARHQGEKDYTAFAEQIGIMNE